MKPYYDSGGITIYHGDCRDILPSISADAVITDPPYGVGVKYGDEYSDTKVGYWAWLIPTINMMRWSAPVVAFTHRVTALAYLEGWDWIGVWNKPMSFGCRVGNSPVLPHWEPIFLYGVFSLGVKGEMLSDVISCNPERAGNINKGLIGREKWKKGDMAKHPTPKPIRLYSKLIKCLSKKSVIDPFMGSGTTLRAAKDLGRRAIGIEIEERYCEIAAKRMSQEVLF